MMCYSFSEIELTALCNQVKDIVTNNLAKEGYLAEETRKGYLRTHFITIAKKSQLFSWFRPKNPEKERVQIYISCLNDAEDLDDETIEKPVAKVLELVKKETKDE